MSQKNSNIHTCLFDSCPGKKKRFYNPTPLIYIIFIILHSSFDDDLTGVKDGGVDPALSVADGQLAAGVHPQDFGAARPGSGRHTVGVVPAPVPHQHAIIVPGIELNMAKCKNLLS